MSRKQKYINARNLWNEAADLNRKAVAAHKEALAIKARMEGGAA